MIITKYYLNRESDQNESTCIEPIADYATKEEAMLALKTFAAIIGKQVEFKEGTEFGGEPAIWAHYVTDMMDARYYVTEETEDEDGNPVDIFGQPVIG